MSEQRESFSEWLYKKRNEPVVITVQRFLCPHCRRGHSKRKAALEHIARCFKNPDVRGCKTCVFHEPAFTAPSSSWCFPGQQCSCNDMDEHCSHAGGPETLPELVTGCRLWKEEG